jgi:hypothetical protein
MTPPPPHSDTLFRQAIVDMHTKHYAAHVLRGVKTRMFTANQAIALPLLRSSARLLASQTHVDPKMPRASLDTRLVQWFKACEAAGADLADIETKAGELVGAMGRLLNLGATQSLLWLQNHGVERHLVLTLGGPIGKRQASPLVATLAYQGYPRQAKAFLRPGQRLSLEDRTTLWTTMWEKERLGQANAMIDLLLEYGPVPAWALKGLSSARVNPSTIDRTLVAARRLLAEGCSWQGSRMAGDVMSDVLKNTSEAANDLLGFFLEQGLDPMEACKLGPYKPQHPGIDWALKLCFDENNQPDVRFGHFLRLARAMKPQQLLAQFPHDRIEGLNRLMARGAGGGEPMRVVFNKLMLEAQAAATRQLESGVTGRSTGPRL